MKKFIILLLFISPVLGLAQTFENAIGIRGGITAGIEYRYYTDDANAYKFLLGTRDDGIQLHAMKEFHQYDLFRRTDRLVFFYGAGIHAGYEKWLQRYSNYNSVWYQDRYAFLAGMDALVGLEYMFYEVPISLGLEAKPYFDIFGRSMFRIELFDIAFTLKYRF